MRKHQTSTATEAAVPQWAFASLMTTPPPLHPPPHTHTQQATLSPFGNSLFIFVCADPPSSNPGTPGRSCTSPGECSSARPGPGGGRRAGRAARLDGDTGCPRFRDGRRRGAARSFPPPSRRAPPAAGRAGPSRAGPGRAAGGSAGRGGAARGHSPSPAPAAVRRVTTAERRPCPPPAAALTLLVGTERSRLKMAAMSCLLGSHMAPGGRWGWRRESCEGEPPPPPPLPPARTAGTPHAAAGRSAPPRPAREAATQRAPPQPGGARPAVAGVAQGGDSPFPPPPPPGRRGDERLCCVSAFRWARGEREAARRERAVRRPARG